MPKRTHICKSTTNLCGASCRIGCRFLYHRSGHENPHLSLSNALLQSRKLLTCIIPYNNVCPSVIIKHDLGNRHISECKSGQALA